MAKNRNSVRNRAWIVTPKETVNLTSLPQALQMSELHMHFQILFFLINVSACSMINVQFMHIVPSDDTLHSYRTALMDTWILFSVATHGYNILASATHQSADIFLKIQRSTRHYNEQLFATWMMLQSPFAIQTNLQYDWDCKLCLFYNTSDVPFDGHVTLIFRCNARA